MCIICSLWEADKITWREAGQAVMEQVKVVKTEQEVEHLVNYLVPKIREKEQEQLNPEGETSETK
jgi:hypothetical protein